MQHPSGDARSEPEDGGRDEGAAKRSVPGGWDASPATDPAAQAETERRLIAAITQNGRYRIIERLTPPPFYHAGDGTPTKRALYLDVETTGVGADDRIIQFAAAAFDFSPADGRIFSVHPCESWYEDPGMPIPPEITELTGITDAHVTGKRIDDARVERMAQDAVLVIAHNASFDRPRVEARFPVFADKHWACSCHEIPWEEEGLQGRKLEWLAFRLCGTFFDAHRADGDVTMGIHLLAQQLPKTKRFAMEALLAAARLKTARVWALDTPIASKERLKARGYRWNAGEDQRPKAWYRDISPATLLDETTWLATAGVYPGAPQHRVQLLDARTRHSARTSAVVMRPYQEVLGGAGSA